SQAMPSPASTRSISSRVANIARCIATTASAPCRRAVVARLPAKSALHHPPLRPEAPKPTLSHSQITTRSVGSACSSAYAVHSPVNPAPAIATSATTSPSSGGRSVLAPAGSVAFHKLGAAITPGSMLPRMIRTETREHVVIITIDNPPVNALPVAGWFALAEALRAAGRDRNTRVVILRAEGKGFQAGVDIKELAADPTNESLIGVNRGCYEAFAAVYDCEVPVICAVQGFCVGGGIGLAGNADIVIASDDATFGLPEVDRGAL